MSVLLARYAEHLFWMGRYMERAENLARILEIQETFSRDSHGGSNWFSIVELNADHDRFYERHAKATSATVTDFYVLDAENPTSIISAVREARDNARALRPLISTEMWMHINVFYNKMRELTPKDVTQPELTRICAMIKENVQAHTGITEGTFFRDQGWYFYQLGRHLERADQTTRLLDIKYHLLLPSVDAVGSPLDMMQWNALLRAVAGYHAFRRIHPRGMSPSGVSGFLLFDTAFPRSVMLCVNTVDTLLHQLRSRFSLRGGGDSLERTDELRAILGDRDIDRVLAAGLHEFLDWIQMMLGAVSSDLGRDFFGYRDRPRVESPMDTVQ